MGSPKGKIFHEKSAGFCFILAEAKRSHPVTFKILTAVTESAIFWDVTQCFAGTCWLHHQV
jgi:hypothetical protein